MPLYPQADRRVWTDDDFEIMYWHDATVHAVAVESAQQDRHAWLTRKRADSLAREIRGADRLLLDLDYALGDDFEPGDELGRTKDWPSFWMSPATLVFEDIADLEGEVGLNIVHRGQLALDTVSRSEPADDGRRSWSLRGHTFRLTFSACGYRMFVRREPVLVAARTFLAVEERGGLSFAEG